MRDFDFVVEERSYETPCWIWQGYIAPSGYGEFWRAGRKVPIHRDTYEVTYGKIPSGMCVCHHCDVRSCANPEHLILGTQKDNIADMHAKGRGQRGGNHWTRHKPERVARGENNGFAKLTDDQARQIKRLIAEGGLTYSAIGERFDISRYTVGLIAKGKRWRHVDAA